MTLKTKHLTALTKTVRNFIQTAQIPQVNGIIPQLVLNVPDVATMLRLHVSIIEAMDESMMIVNNERPTTRIGEGIVELEYGGVQIVLICTQLFESPDGLLRGYNSLQFRTINLSKPR